MCLYPLLMINKKYTVNEKNKGYVPKAEDKRVLRVPVSCGKCFECMRAKKREWQIRLSEDIRVNKNAKFVTFTFSNDSLLELEKQIKWSKSYYIRSNEVATLAVRRFLERWRRKFKKSVRHWLITELGQTKSERLHLHGLIWTDEENDVIEERWCYGHIWVGDYVNEKTINYIVKYVNKQDLIHKNYRPKILASPGIGKVFLDRPNAKIFKKKDIYINSKGFKMGLPTYYRNKLYDDEERERLWLEKLDEEVRYVDGKKIDVSNDDDSVYWNARDYAREKNLRLGYGSDISHKDEKEYRRSLINIKRLKYIKKGVKKDKIYLENRTGNSYFDEMKIFKDINDEKV